MFKREYTGIEVFRFLFACLIPLLHIGFTDVYVIDILRQYVSRLGVPFFFSVSGMFLGAKLRDSNFSKGKYILCRYIKKIGIILLFWMAIYTPLIIKTEGFSLKEFVFRTPGFLWYLTSLIIASIPFCLLKKRTVLFATSALLYIFGTIFGDTYGQLFGLYPVILKTIITTRNGLFFGLPMMCIGELAWGGGKSNIKLVLSGLLLFLEITLVGAWDIAYDRSMYLFLPLFILYLLRIIKDWNPTIECRLGKISSLIYLMQYGIITMTTIFIGNSNMICSLCYILVIVIPIVLYYSIKENKWTSILF